MIDWNTAIQIFIAGVSIVMLVMVLLQVSVNLSARVVRLLEHSGEKVAEQKNEKA